MDKLVAFFKNVWFKRGVAVACWGYTALMVWVAWLNFGYYFQYENATALFVLYLFINIAALGLMIYTRKQVITMVNVMVLLPIVFAIVIFGFGNWYMIVPPLAVAVAMFFICAANETLKTVLGTMYLLLYVIGIVAYVAVNLFMGDLSFVEVDLSERDTDYLKLSPTGEYRIVRYVDPADVDRRTAGYYVEITTDDVEIPFGSCQKVFGCQKIFRCEYSGKQDDPVNWLQKRVDGVMTEMLNVEGSIKENPYLAKDDETEETKDTASSATSSSGENAATEETAEQSADSAA